MYLNRKYLLVQILYIEFMFYFISVQCKIQRIEDRKLVHGRFTRDITNFFHIVVPQKVQADGSFHSHHLPHFYSASVRKKRNLEEERVHYKINFNGSTHILDLEPYAHITSPGMLVETRAQGSDLTGTTFRRPHKHLCHFRGTVRGIPDSRVALSGCDGLVGHIRTKDGIFFIEPLHGKSPEEGKEHHHVVYKRSIDTLDHTCKVRGDWWTTWCSRIQSVLDSKLPRKRSEAGTSVPRYYEAMVTADKKFLVYHKDHDVEEYIICIMNMVSDLYHDATVGNMIDIVIVRIIYLEKQENELDLEINTRGETTLESFCKWQAQMNPKDTNHPNHHDIGILFTRFDICSESDNSCSLLGLAPLGAACTNDQNCCINEDAGLLLGVVTAHEMGHTLGCSHDSPEESGCEPVTPTGDASVMNPMVTADASGWSSCSRGFITGLFDSQLGECLLDEPKDHTYPLDDMPPGAFYDANEQCSFTFGSTYTHFDHEGDKLCQRLWCKARGGASATTMGQPPAEGTKCGPDKWCYNKECVEMGRRPAAVNGEWGQWGSWTECSRTCGGGVIMRERMCNNPAPSNKGRFCLGKRHEFNLCNTEQCPGKPPTFRETQCEEFNSKPYQGVMHTWKALPAPDSDPNPCALYCVNEQRVFTKLAPRVKDGTRCRAGTRDTCVQGSCLSVGCDWRFNSDAVEDVCGICNGDGTHCTLVEGTFKEKPQPGYIPIITVPPGATNLRLEETQPSGNMIAVSAIDNQTFYLNGAYTENLAGEYSFGGGVVGVLSRPERDKDELHIKGPLMEPLVLYVCLFEMVNAGVFYSFAVPSETPMYTPRYHWEFLEWGPCSAICGGGTQIMKGYCIEERDGKVKDSFCNNLTKEETRARTCNDQACRTRWKVWKWGPCSGCVFQSGSRTRQVECVKENPTNTGDEEIITDPSECCGDPPKKVELCNSPHPCPKNMTSNIIKRREIEVIPIKHQMSKRDNDTEGKSFSDDGCTLAQIIKDPVNPDSIHLEEVMLDESPLNLTEEQFETVGEEVPDQVLSCPIQNLTGKEAMDRLEELIHGPGNKKLKNKMNNNGTTDKHSTGTAKTTNKS